MARRTLLGSLIGGTIAAWLVVACSSLPDLHFADDEAGTEGGVNPLCKGGGPEICNDGVDNDCNLLTDCKDSVCTANGFGCETVPAGWTAVTFSASARPSCGPGETPVDLKVAAGDSTATCNCSCNAVGGSCASGNFTVSSSSEATCLVTPTTTMVPVDNAACTALNGTIALSTHAMATPLVAPSSCSAVAALNGALTNGRLCQAPGTGGGCAAGQVCALKSSNAAGLASCVTMNGKAACPAGFPNRSTAGTDATDTRSCNGCACSPPTPCSGGSVSLYDNPMCKTNGAFKSADNITATCNALAPSSGFTATHFKSTPPTGGCGSPASQGTVTGAVAFVNERTVCCK